MSDLECKKFMVDLIEQNTDNWRTRWYDRAQRIFTGIL